MLRRSHEPHSSRTAAPQLRREPPNSTTPSSPPSTASQRPPQHRLARRDAARLSKLATTEIAGTGRAWVSACLRYGVSRAAIGLWPEAGCDKKIAKRTDWVVGQLQTKNLVDLDPPPASLKASQYRLRSLGPPSWPGGPIACLRLRSLSGSSRARSASPAGRSLRSGQA
jgi:hypothetical protein